MKQRLLGNSVGKFLLATLAIFMKEFYFSVSSGRVVWIHALPFQACGC